MTDNEKVAALAAALTGMRAERERYRAAWLEATAQRDDLQERLRARVSMSKFRIDLRDNLIDDLRQERDALETALEHAKNTLGAVREDNIELSNELSQARNRIFSLEYSLSQVRKQRDGLIAWWQDANGYVEEAGM